MYGSLQVIIPVFVLIGFGYVFAWAGIFRERVGEGLTSYILNLAVPFLVFRAMALANLPDASPWGYWLSYFFGAAFVWLVCGLLGRIILGGSVLSNVVIGCTGSYSNTMLLGLPLVLTVFGDRAEVPLFLLITVHLPVMMFAAIFAGESARSGRLAITRPMIAEVGRGIFGNPVIIAIIIGFIWRFTGFEIPDIATGFINMIADTAVPCALVAMGITVRRYGVGGDKSGIALILFFKLIVHPLAVWLLAVHVFDLPRLWAMVAVLFAAAPPGINNHILATHFGVARGAVSGAIAIGTGLCLITIPFWLWVIGAD